MKLASMLLFIATSTGKNAGSEAVAISHDSLLKRVPHGNPTSSNEIVKLSNGNNDEHKDFEDQISLPTLTSKFHIPHPIVVNTPAGSPWPLKTPLPTTYIPKIVIPKVGIATITPAIAKSSPSIADKPPAVSVVVQKGLPVAVAVVKTRTNPKSTTVSIPPGRITIPSTNQPSPTAPDHNIKFGEHDDGHHRKNTATSNGEPAISNPGDTDDSNSTASTAKAPTSSKTTFASPVLIVGASFGVLALIVAGVFVRLKRKSATQSIAEIPQPETESKHDSFVEIISEDGSTNEFNNNT
ncbi:hypothetical protein HDV01_000712 [Terramyces sp. JEL0728]|nr:hypothetical protein HDV01_000712 [Terramyces sp. JEL0728]